MPTVELCEIIAPRLGLIDPLRYPGEVFDLYSVPAFDRGEPEVVYGREIGSAKQIVESGDVLLSKIVPHIRRSWTVGDSRGRRIIASGEWIVFRSHRAHPQYLRHVLVSDQFHVEFMGTVSGVGGSLLRARPAYVGKIKIPFPPLPEQRRIAEVLDRADALRAKRRAALAQFSCLQRSFFIDLFGNPANNPKGWSVEALGNSLVFVTSGGRGWAEFYAQAGSRFIRSLDVQMNKIGDDGAVFVEPPDNAEARRTRVREGDVLLTITGSRIGRVAAVPAELAGSYVSQHVAILRPDISRLNAYYLSFFLNLESGGQRQIRRLQYGQTKPGLNFEQIRSFVLPVPPIALQRQFADRVAKIEQLRAIQRASLNELDLLFASLQQAAFAGELSRAIRPSINQCIGGESCDHSSH